MEKNKKLQLNKEKIAQLNQENMNNIKGGTLYTYASKCETCNMAQSICVCVHSYGTHCNVPDCLIPCETTSYIAEPTALC